MNYIRNAAGVAGLLSVIISFTAIAAVLAGAFTVAAAGSFLILFPLILLTLPAIRRFEKRAKVAIKVKVDAMEADIAKLKSADGKASVDVKS